MPVSEHLIGFCGALRVTSVMIRGWVIPVSIALATAATVRADRVEDLARIHVEAIGGQARIAALAALRASGHVLAAGKQVQFTMTAARPAKVRLETEAGGRTLVQATNGVELPWEFDSSTAPARPRTMADSLAKTFIADAEFDDPLVAGASRGYVFDYAGELQVEGRKLHRVLVTRKMTDTFSLLVDDETYFIVMRVEHRTSAGGRKLQIVTHYEDFRPVDGVLLPHQVTVAIDGRMTQQTKITRIEANPRLQDSLFTRPIIPTTPAVRDP
jgi:hypothetical protein